MVSRVGAVVTALPSHQCGPGSIPDLASYVGWVCGWFPALLQEVFLRLLRLFPLLKNQHFKISIWSGPHGASWVNKLHFTFYIFFFILWRLGKQWKRNKQFVCIVSTEVAVEEILKATIAYLTFSLAGGENALLVILVDVIILSPHSDFCDRKLDWGNLLTYSTSIRIFCNLPGNHCL